MMLNELVGEIANLFLVILFCRDKVIGSVKFSLLIFEKYLLIF